MMRLTKFPLFPVILLLSAFSSAAQEMPELDDENASDALAQSLEYFQSHPVNLNRATPDEIAAIPLLYPLEALAVARYLQKHPRLSDPALLVRDSVISQQTLDDILPYICFNARDQARLPSVELRASVQRKHPADGGSASDPYRGSALATRQKLLARRGSFELTALTQKDAGERSLADFASAGLSWAPGTVITQAVIGDFQLSYGQGLAFGGTSPRFLSAQSGGPSGSGAARLRANYSADEWSFLRGGAVMAAVGGDLSLVAYASAKTRDGSVDSANAVRTIDNSGYHRSQREKDKRGTVTERIGGLRIEHQTLPNLRIGISGYGIQYRPDFSPGERIAPGAGVDGAYDFNRGQLYWEAAAPLKRRPAFMAGGRAEVGALRTYLCLRHYGPDYSAPRANAPGSSERDERGVTVGTSLRAPLATTASALFDHSQPVSTAGALARGHGGRFIESVIASQLIPGLRVEWRWRRKQAEEVSSDPSFPFPVASRTASRIGVRWEIDRRLSLAAQYEVCRYRREGSGSAPRGDLLRIGASAVPAPGWRVAASTAFFSVQSYDARLYGSEPELSGTGSFHPFYGQGRRDALMASYAFRTLLSLQAKVARQQRLYSGEDARQTDAGLSLLLTY